ncbi:MAG: 4-hydroxythreonine-4-phosphate dehydrogenase PdxA [Magnetospirillum sp.]|nr:4-hydroxythreonine-4-phosphate dehydrogenase PdxA [Magnetospirillum sp.]
MATIPLPPLALTMGEPAGIGADIALKAWGRRHEGVAPFFLIDDPARLRRAAGLLGLDVPVAEIADPAEAGPVFATALPVIPQPLVQAVEPGRPDPANAKAVQESIARAVAMARAGTAAGVVTNPIHKQVMYRGGFAFPGHTEFLASLLAAELTGPGGREAMMLACPGLRVVPVTIHVALAEAIRTLRREDIVAIGVATAAALVRDFGIRNPRLAVAALNPHGGEDGSMGREEIDIIAPAVADLAAAGIMAFGPRPADTLFHPRARAEYDAVLCMYHDQALIPLKTIDFDGGVNITLGLPIVRTSPDHGTALDLAGTGKASEASLVAALRTAAEIAANRRRSAPPR